MPKRPKYRRGFTWGHHVDEWWDRRPHEWKIRLFLWTGILAVVGAAGIYFWLQRWMAREEILAEAKRIHQQRIEGLDRSFTSKESSGGGPELREGASIEVRSEE